MSEHIFQQTQPEWLTPYDAGVCEACDWVFLAPSGKLTRTCPHCFQEQITPITPSSQALANLHPPELIIPFTITEGTLADGLRNFSSGIPFAPDDLNPQSLRSRSRSIFLPVWLVDCSVIANWKAEMGYNYEVISHQDSYDDHSSRWQSRQVKETRVRWEPRIGRLSRTYQNVPAPAMEEARRLEAALGQFPMSQAKQFDAAPSGAFIRLPNRTTEDAWTEAVAALQNLAMGECCQAASADYIRQYEWQPSFPSANWTLLLEPVLSTYYLDDDNHPQIVLIHGLTGKVSGMRRSSMKKATRTATILFVIAAILFVLSLLMGLISVPFPPLAPVTIISLVVALGLATGGGGCLLTAWQFNRKPR
ncbi:MAG TPA: hypothetical protein VIO61_14295 [Anaerolineaceae bacterium]